MFTNAEDEQDEQSSNLPGQTSNISAPMLGHLHDTESEFDFPLPPPFCETLCNFRVWTVIIYVWILAYSVVITFIIVPVIGAAYFNNHHCNNAMHIGLSSNSKYFDIIYSYSYGYTSGFDNYNNDNFVDLAYNNRRQHTTTSNPNDSSNSCGETLYALWCGIFTSIGGLFGFLLQGYIGKLSDMYGRRCMLIFSWFTVFISQGCFNFTRNIWYWFFLLPVSQLSGTFGGINGTVQASLADIVHPFHRTMIYGILYGTVGGIIVISSIATAIVSKYFGIKGVIYSFDICIAIGLVWVLFVYKETLPVKIQKHNRRKYSKYHNNDKNNKNSDKNADKQHQIIKCDVETSVDKNNSNQSLSSSLPPKDNNMKKQIHVKRNRIQSFASEISNDPNNISYLVPSDNDNKNKCYNCGLCENFVVLKRISENGVIFWLAILSFFTQLPECGLQDLITIYLLYFMNKKHFHGDTSQQAQFTSICVAMLGASMLLSQVLLLPLLNRYLCKNNDLALFTVGILLLLITCSLGVYLYINTSYLVAYSLRIAIGISTIISPITTSALSKRLSKKEQGLGIGIIQSMKGVAYTIAPFLFSFLFHFFRDDGIFVTMPFIVGFVVFGAIALPILLCPVKNVLNKYDKTHRRQKRYKVRFRRRSRNLSIVTVEDV